jgi:hypothetical protein
MQSLSVASHQAAVKVLKKQLGISKERANVMLLTAVHRVPGGMDENKRNCIVRSSSLMTSYRKGLH